MIRVLLVTFCILNSLQNAQGNDSLYRFSLHGEFGAMQGKPIYGLHFGYTPANCGSFGLEAGLDIQCQYYWLPFIYINHFSSYDDVHHRIAKIDLPVFMNIQLGARSPLSLAPGVYVGALLFGERKGYHSGIEIIDNASYTYSDPFSDRQVLRKLDAGVQLRFSWKVNCCSRCPLLFGLKGRLGLTRIVGDLYDRSVLFSAGIRF